MKLSNIFKKNTTAKNPEVIKVDKKLLEKIIGGGDPLTDLPAPKKMMGAPKIGEATA